MIFRKFEGFDVFLLHRSLRCCVIVVAPLQPQLRCCFVPAVLLLSTLQPQSVFFFRHELLLVFVTFYENSTVFGVIQIIVRFVWCLLCRCRVPLQPQFLLIFVVFYCENSTDSASFILRSLCVVLSVLLLSRTPATVRYFSDRVDSSLVFRLRFSAAAAAYTNSRPHSLLFLGWRNRPPPCRPRSMRQSSPR